MRWTHVSGKDSSVVRGQVETLSIFKLTTFDMQQIYFAMRHDFHVGWMLQIILGAEECAFSV